MSEPSLPELEAERERLYAELAQVGDFRRGSGQRERREVREAELRLRGAGSSRPRPAVPWTRTVAAGPGGRQLGRAGGREGAPGDGGLRGSSVAGRADH